MPKVNTTGNDELVEVGSDANPRAHDDAFLELIGPSDKRLPILEARYNLVWIDIPKNVTEGKPYEGVRCSYCPVDWTKQKQAPNTGTFISCKVVYCFWR